MSDRFTNDQLARFSRTVVDAIHTPTVVIDHAGSIQAANRALAELIGETGVLTGRSLLQVAGGSLDQPDLREALEQVLPRAMAFDDVAVELPGGSTVFASGKALAAAGSDELVVVAFDRALTDQRTDEAVESDWLFRVVVDTVREPLLVLSYADHRVQFANSAFFRTFRVSESEVSGQHLPDIGHGQWDIPELRAALDDVLARDTSFERLEVEHDFPEIGHRVMLLNGRRIDHLRLILLAFEDITEQRRARRLEEARLSELAHTIKNLFAMVQALAYQTPAPTPDAYKDAFLGRVKALAVSQGILLESEWQRADLRQLLAGLLLPHLHGHEERIEMSGPAAPLSKDQTSALALVVNELATNAMKYGALSNETGRVMLTWEVGDDRLHLKWRELGGPEVNPEPETGFGTLLIEQLSGQQLGGRAEQTFDPSGLLVQIEFPLST